MPGVKSVSVSVPFHVALALFANASPLLPVWPEPKSSVELALSVSAPRPWVAAAPAERPSW